MTKSKSKNSKPLASHESTITIQRGERKVPDTYARITDSLLKSEAFKSLAYHEKMLCISMRVQEYGKRKPNRDYDENSEYWSSVCSDLCFYYSFATAKDYSDRYKNNSGRLYKDIDALIEHGFIEKVISGKGTREKSVYKYSDKWQHWKPTPK